MFSLVRVQQSPTTEMALGNESRNAGLQNDCVVELRLSHVFGMLRAT